MAARAFPRPARRIAIGIKRVSLLKQVGNYSFDGQGNKFALLADKYDCDIPAELMIEDKGYSGTDFNRPSIRLAKKQIRAGVANAVAFPWIDRFSRDVEGGLATIREFRELKADVLLGDLGWYQDSGWFRMQMNMFLTVAQYQRDDIAEKSRYGVMAKLAKGLAHFGAPYGWHMVTAREIAARALNANEEVPTGRPQNFYERRVNELEVVQLIGELALAGGREGTQRGICRELDSRGIKTPGGKLGWNPITVAAIANDWTYSSGEWWYGKRKFIEPKKVRNPEAERHKVRTVKVFKPREEWAGKIEMPGGGIWTPDEQAAIIEGLKRNGAASTGKPARRAEDGGQVAILSTLVSCGATVISGEGIGEECKKAMAPAHGSAVKDDGTRTLYYRCTHRHKTEGHYECDSKSVRADILHPGVWNGLKTAVCDQLESLVAEKFGEVVTPDDEAELARLREERKRKDQKRREAMRKEIDADSDEDKAEYAGLVAKYKTELALLDRRIEAGAGEVEPEQYDLATIQRLARKAFQTTDPVEQQAILLDWIPAGGIRYAHGWAEITILVRLNVANCKQPERAIYNKQLQVTTRVRIAA